LVAWLLHFLSWHYSSEVLRKHGPKEVVKHFYETLLSKAFVIPKQAKPFQDKDIAYKKAQFSSRQSLRKGQHPALVCALLEQSMKSPIYTVNEIERKSHDKDSCECCKCFLHRQSEDVNFIPDILKDNGDGTNCSLYLTDFEEDCNKFLYITPNFAMSHLCHLNMLTDLDSYYPGVSFPFVYVGGLHSFFPLHIEDMSLPSFNYMHMGHPKLW